MRCGGGPQPMLSEEEPSASEVRIVRRPGWTPRFSQLIQDSRAVRSEDSESKLITFTVIGADSRTHHSCSSGHDLLWSHPGDTFRRRSGGRNPPRGLPGAGQCRRWPAAGCRFSRGAFRTGRWARGRAVHQTLNLCCCEEFSENLGLKSVSNWMKIVKWLSLS